MAGDIEELIKFYKLKIAEDKKRLGVEGPLGNEVLKQYNGGD